MRAPSDEQFPTAYEITRWLSDTFKHAVHIEYYLEKLQIGRSDIQRPHDIVGHGNKLEWTAIRGFAMQYRRELHTFEKYVKPALDFHRQQYHHLAWNEFNPTASPDAMRLGAVDAVCSLLEPRGYQGGCHTWEDIHAVAENNPIHKVAWMQLVAMEMKKIEKPSFEGADVNPLKVPRNGISIEKWDIIRERIHETLGALRHDHGILVEV